jgi:DNA invertase Pin-like site-specific DNA recombinase
MLAAAHSRSFDAVVCWKLDRLGRSLKHLIATIEDLSAYGVAFISLRDNLDLSTPSGRLMMHIIGAMAQFERELIKERVSAGMDAAWKRGSRIGRPRAYANAGKIRALRAQDAPGARLRLSSANWYRNCGARSPDWRCSVTNPHGTHNLYGRDGISTTAAAEEERRDVRHAIPADPCLTAESR